MASSGYTAITFVANEQPTTAKWNLIGSNDASFNNGNGFEDGIIVNRHLATGAVKQANLDFTNFDLSSTSETDTGRKYYDGRTIYRKLLVGNINVIAGSIGVTHGISGITSLELLRVQGNMRLGSTTRGTIVNMFTHRETAGNWCNLVSMDGTQVSFNSSFAWGTSAYTIILEYVK